MAYGHRGGTLSWSSIDLEGYGGGTTWDTEIENRDRKCASVGTKAMYVLLVRVHGGVNPLPATFTVMKCVQVKTTRAIFMFRK